jgi:hypothetical protein
MTADYAELFLKREPECNFFMRRDLYPHLLNFGLFSHFLPEFVTICPWGSRNGLSVLLWA